MEIKYLYIKSESKNFCHYATKKLNLFLLIAFTFTMSLEMVAINKTMYLFHFQELFTPQ